MVVRVARAPDAPATEPDDGRPPVSAAGEHPGIRLTPMIALGLVILGVVLGLIAGTLIERSRQASGPGLGRAPDTPTYPIAGRIQGSFDAVSPNDEAARAGEMPWRSADPSTRAR